LILIAGGDADPNIEALARAAEARGAEVCLALTGAAANPRLDWDVQADVLTVGGQAVAPRAVFIRNDVFQHMADPRPETSFRAGAWYAALHGWALAHEGVRLLNRRYRGQTNKPFMLSAAARCGLPVPATRITNALDALERDGAADRIAKPVPGGGYCTPLVEVLSTTQRRDGLAAAPAIVQERLVAPEVRIFGIGDRFIPFHVRSEALDYRTSADTRVEPLPLDGIDPALLAALRRLMVELEMDFAAADFKSSPATGALVFLEINSSPMFAAFDRAAGGAVTEAILERLMEGSA
jgi:glutathione synthase/RimK-type ligase-like ATP-grasp enzyme